MEFNAGHKCAITQVSERDKRIRSASVETDKRGDLAGWRSHCIFSMLNSEQFSGTFLDTYLDNKKTDLVQSKLTLGHNLNHVSIFL